MMDPSWPRPSDQQQNFLFPKYKQKLEQPSRQILKVGILQYLGLQVAINWCLLFLLDRLAIYIKYQLMFLCMYYTFYYALF